MSHPAHPLSLQELLQLIRYELRLTRDDMALTCGLCPCCYDELEQDGDADIGPELVDAIEEQLPNLSQLLQERQQTAGGPDFADRISDLESQTPSERAIELQRVRLELQWLESQAQED